MVKLLILTVVVSLITRCSPELLCKKVILEISRNSQENTCARDSFLIKLQVSGLKTNFIKKESLSQVFSCEFWEILEIPKEHLFYRTLRWLLLFNEFLSNRKVPLISVINKYDSLDGALIVLISML